MNDCMNVGDYGKSEGSHKLAPGVLLCTNTADLDSTDGLCTICILVSGIFKEIYELSRATATET